MNFFGKKKKDRSTAAAEPAPEQTGSDVLHPVIAEISRAFEEHELRFRTERIDNCCVLTAGVTGVFAPYYVRFICSDENADSVGVRVFGIAVVPESRKTDVLRLLNSIHQDFRFFRFVLDEENSIDMEYDLLISSKNMGLAAREMLIRIMNVVDELYPMIHDTIS